MTAWEKEKAYRARRAEQLKGLLYEAIKNNDADTFMTLFPKLNNYIHKKEMKAILIDWITRAR